MGWTFNVKSATNTIPNGLLCINEMNDLSQAVDDEVVGKQFLDYLGRNPGNAHVDRTPELITLSVIDMVLSGMEEAMKQRGVKDEIGQWLKTILTGAWKDFEENVRVFALHYCCEQ
jgi:hypothetical protein